jgi:ABC-type glycerol-3-phosphate transport system substrate-binding protein
MMGYDDWLLDKDTSKLFGAITPELYTLEELQEICFTQSLERTLGSDGEVYVVPMGTGATVAGILYHSDLFEEAGIYVNDIETWQDAKEVSKKLTTYNSDGTIKRSGMSFSWHNSGAIWLSMISAQGAGDKLLNGDTGVWNFNIPEAKESMRFIQSFVEDNIFDPAVGDVFTAFPNKQMAQMSIGPWALGAWGDQYPEMKLEYYYMPKYQGTKQNVHNIDVWFVLAISKRLKGEKRDAALIFIKEALENPDVYNIPLSNGYWVGVPGSKKYVEEIKALAEKGEAPSRAAELSAEIASKFVPNMIFLPTRISMPELLQATIYPEMQNVFLGKKSIDEICDYLSTILTTKEQEKM